jgi:hypothetical protein
MKKIILGLFVIVFLVINVEAQDIVHMDSVSNLVLKNSEKLDSVFKDCELHYALIKMEIDNRNQITDVNSLNHISEEFLNLFIPLKKMNFSRSKKLKKSVIFLYVVYPRRDCKIREGERYNKIKIDFFIPELLDKLISQIKYNSKTIYGGVIVSNSEYLEVRRLPKL